VTTPPCATGCGSPSPSAVICTACQDSLRATLAMAALIDEQPLPYDPAASAARQSLSLALADAVYGLTGPHGWPIADTTISGMARWLLARMPQVAASPHAARDHDAIRRAAARCAMVLDGPPQRAYAGPCPACGHDVLGQPGAVFAQCENCGQDVEVRHQQDAMKGVVADLLGTAEWCATASSALGSPVSDSAVRMWALRKRLVAHGQRPSLKGGEPVPLYRVGDVMKLADAMAARHVS
jgi:hypothetical protein